MAAASPMTDTSTDGDTDEKNRNVRELQFTFCIYFADIFCPQNATCVFYIIKIFIRLDALVHVLSGPLLFVNAKLQ